MERISITLQGADSAHRHRIRQRATRVFLFPDGIERVIVATVGRWEVYDRTLEWLRMSDEEFAREVFTFAKKFAKPELEFEAQLHSAFRWNIVAWSRDYRREAND